MKKYFFLVFIYPLLILACNAPADPEDQQSEMRDTGNMSYVKMEPVLHEVASTSLKSLGIVISKTEAKPSFKTGGIIDKTFFNEGDVVKKDQLLATLILSEIDAKVTQAAEGVSKAERDLQRAQNLHADSVATLEQVQNATTALAVARQNLEIAEFNRKYSEVRAPISGKIVRKLLHAGELAGPGSPIAVVLGVGRQDWRIKSGLVPADWSRVDIGQKAEVELEAFPSQLFKAVVTDKAVLATDGSGTLDIELIFTEQPPALAAGMIGKVSLPFKIDVRQTTIPIDALVNTNGRQATVFTIRGDKALSVPIHLTRILGDRVIVQEGLEGIDSVVTIGAVYLESGDLVSIASH